MQCSALITVSFLITWHFFSAFYSATRAFSVLALISMLLTFFWLLGRALENLLQFDPCTVISLILLNSSAGYSLLQPFVISLFALHFVLHDILSFCSHICAHSNQLFRFDVATRIHERVSRDFDILLVFLLSCRLHTCAAYKLSCAVRHRFCGHTERYFEHQEKQVGDGWPDFGRRWWRARRRLDQ